MDLRNLKVPTGAMVYTVRETINANRASVTQITLQIISFNWTSNLTLGVLKKVLAAQPYFT